MAIEKIINRIIVDVDNRNGRHKVSIHGVLRDDASELDDKQFSEPAKRADIEAILGDELGINAEAITALSDQLTANDAETALMAKDKDEALALVEQQAREIERLKKALEGKSQSNTIGATSLRLALLKVGFGPNEIEEVLSAYEVEDPIKGAEVRIIWEYNTHYDRTDPLVDFMAARAGLEPEQVDALFGIAPVSA